MKPYIKDAISAALAEVTERPVPDLAPGMRLDADFDLDSYLFVQFLLTLEDKLPGLRFDPEALGQADFNDLGSLAEYLSGRLADASEAADA